MTMQRNATHICLGKVRIETKKDDMRTRLAGNNAFLVIVESTTPAAVASGKTTTRGASIVTIFLRVKVRIMRSLVPVLGSIIALYQYQGDDRRWKQTHREHMPTYSIVILPSLAIPMIVFISASDGSMFAVIPSGIVIP